MSIMFLPFVTRRVDSFGDLLRSTVRRAAPIGLITAGMSLSLMAALELSLVVYVGSVKNLSAFFSVIAGRLFFQERGTAHRAVGALVMCIGTVLILVS